MAYKQYEEAYERARVNERSAAVADGLQKAFATFRTVRDTRAKKSQEAEDFKLDNQIRTLKLKQLENDPTQDPAILEATRKQLKLGASIKQKQDELTLKQLDRQGHDITQQATILKQEAEQLQALRESNPQIFGNMDLDPKTGGYVLGKDKKDDRFDKAFKASLSPIDHTFSKKTFDEYMAMADEYEGGRSKVSEETVKMRAPDGSVSSVPKGSVEKYKKKGASIVE